MTAVTPPNPKTPGGRWQPMLIAGLVFLLSAAIAAGLLQWAENNRVAQQRQQAFNLAYSYSQLLQRNVERMYASNYALAAMVGQGNGSIANFDAAAAQLLLANPLLLGLSISPGGVVKNVAPLQGNEKLLGFDHLSDPLQKGEAAFARDTGRLTLAGPVELVQGGLGVVSRLPVFLNDIAGKRQFWGFTNVTMHLSDLLNGVALSGLAARGYQYELWRLQADSGRKQTISASSLSLMQPVRQSLEVPNGAWNLDIAPVGGWHDPKLLGWGAASGGVASLLMAYLAWLLVQQRLYKAGLETQVAQRTAEIFAAQNQLESTLGAIRDPMFELGLDGRYYQCRAPIEDLPVAAAELLIGRTVPEVLPEAAAQIVMDALRLANADGYTQGQQFSLKLARGVRWFELSVARKVVDSGHEPRFVVMSRDITERKTAEQEIRRLAFYDPLTALPNRRLLQDRLEHALCATARTHHQGALFLIDLDNFKALNDTVGHDKGDIMLQQVASRLLSCVRECDTVARLGGDEFVVMVDDVGATPADAIGRAKTIAEKIVLLLGQPYDIAGREHRSSSSVGVALFGVNTGGTADETFKRADVAMYQAKAAGRNTLRFFDPAMQAAVEARAALEVDVRQGLINNEFQLHYQPQVGPGNQVVGAEALLRWTHPRHGAIPPGEFIPVAEQSGLILQLGQWVLEAACAQLAAWAAEPSTATLTLAVNVSVHQFRQSDFVDHVLSAVNGAGADARLLKLELTESMFAFDLEDIISKMTILKAKGVGFSLDDFGTGYSSLSYLKRLPLDQIKIDQSFVRDVLTDPNDASIVRTIITLGRSLGLEVIAEGVETAGQREFLATHGCEWCQGYLISRPVPELNFKAFLLAHGTGQAPD